MKQEIQPEHVDIIEPGSLKMPWYVLSFVDESLPATPGVYKPKYVGQCIVQGESLGAAIMHSHRLGVNPGGAIKAGTVNVPLGMQLKPSLVNRLIGREESFASEHAGPEYFFEKDPDCGFEILTIDPGRNVVCDCCGADWTDRPESGGCYGLMTKAYCPDCAPRIIEIARAEGEYHLIKAFCPPEKSFADWVRQDLR